MREEDVCMRRLFLCALISTLGLMCVFAPGAGAEIVTLDGIHYEIGDGYATFAGFVEGVESVTAHAMVNGFRVQYIWEGEQKENETVKEVAIGPEITDLEQIASFRNLLYMCSAMERIVVPAALIHIGENLSYIDGSLREFVVAQDNPMYRAVDGVLFSKDGRTLLVFPEGKGEEYDIPDGTESMGRSAFGYNERLTRLTVPEDVTELTEGALWGLMALKDIVLPASLVRIDNNSLPGGGSLERITVADNNLYYQSFDGVLFTRDGKTLVDFPSGRGGYYDIPPGTTTIREGAFGTNVSLESLTVPEGITELLDGTLSHMEGLTQLSLPASLRSIGEWALPRYGALEQITVAEGNEHYQTYEGVLFSRDGKTLLLYPAGRDGKYEIPPGTLFLAGNAFGDNEGLTGVTVPDGVTALPRYLFSNAGNLEEIYLPASLREIGEGVLPSYGALKYIEVNPDNPRYKSIDGVLFEGEELIFYPPSHGFSYDVPPGTMHIRDQAFADRENLQTISIPRSVTVIGDMMFYGCTALTRISLPITLKSIGRSAFSNCIALSAIALPPSLEALGEGAFYNCPSLAAVNIPEGVTKMGANVFNGHGQGFVIYATKGSAGYWYAWEYDILWAEPGGVPGAVKPVDRQTQSAVVNNANNQEFLNLSAKPAKGAKSLGKYKNGTTVQVIDTQGNWAHVQLHVAEGYMPLESLVFTDQFNHLTSITWGRRRREMTEPLRLYAEPSEEAPSEAVTEDVSMRILDTVGVWYHVLLKGHEGYVPVQNLNVVHSRLRNDEQAYTGYLVVANPNSQDRLHLREQPSTKSRSLGRYFNGTQVEVIDYGQDGWAHVRVEDKEGYMMLEYLVSIDGGGEQNLWGQG